MRVRVGPAVVAGLFGLLIIVGAVAAGGCGGSIQGHLYVPSPQGAPENLDGVELLHAARAVYHFDEFPPGPRYNLHPANGNADFDIAWYNVTGDLILDDRDPTVWQTGGVIPANATSGLVYLVTPGVGPTVPYCIPDPIHWDCYPGVPGEPSSTRFVVEFWCYPS